MANATIRVQFGSGSAGGGEAQGHLSAEIDTREDGLNGGRSSFEPGETVYILVFTSANVRITDAICSAGSLASSGTAVVPVTEEVMFEDTDTASLNKPARSGLAEVVWFGRSLGELSLTDATSVRASQRGIAVAQVRYEALAQVYALSSPSTLNGQSDFSILALIRGVAT